MLSQRSMLRIAQIKGWEIVRTNRGSLDLSTGTCHAYFTFKEHPAFECQVAQSRVESFKRQVTQETRQWQQ